MNGFWVVPARALAFYNGVTSFSISNFFTIFFFGFCCLSHSLSVFENLVKGYKVYCKVHKYIRRRPQTFEKISQIVLN
jgi:hypothetical protein